MNSGITARLTAIRRSAPRAISVALAFGCVCEVAVSVASILQLRSGPVELAHHQRASGHRVSDPVQIAAAHLFGVALSSSVASSAGAPSTAVAAVLVGVLADPADPTHGGAILRIDSSSHYVSAGGLVAAGLTLERVYADHVLLNRSGQPEMLSLPRALGDQILASTTGEARKPGPAAPDEDDGNGLPSADVLKAKIETENQRLGGVLHASGEFEDGVYRGLIIQPGGNPELFAQLGFRPGDWVTDIDNQPITDPTVLGRLTSGKTVRVGVRRPEGTESIVVNMAVLARFAQN